MDDVKEEVAAQNFLVGLTKVRWMRMGLDLDEIKRMLDEKELD